MKKWIIALCCALVLVLGLVTAMGCVLKYGAFKELEMVKEYPAIAMPFAILTDSRLRSAIEDAFQVKVPALPTIPKWERPPKEATAPEETVPGSEATLPVGETMPLVTPVEDSWYDDALFIGDSRTCGLRDYGRKGEADYFACVGMSVFDCWARRAEDFGFAEQGLSSLLRSKQYRKVFISLGINEIAASLEDIMEEYTKLVDNVKEKQPDAIIILQGVMSVRESKAIEEPRFAANHVYALNREIEALADGERIFYIDVNADFADERGYLPWAMSGDGIHLYGEYYQKWSDWISLAVAKLELPEEG